MEIRLDAGGLGDGVIALRPLRCDDAHWVAAAWRDPEIARWMLLPQGSGPDEVRRWIEAVDGARLAGTDVRFAVIAQGTGEPVGAVGLDNVRWDDGVAEVTFWMTPQARGRGYAAQAVELLSTWALGVLGLERLELLTHPDNAGSQAVARSAGFTAEGVLRSARVIDGRRVDVTVFSLLRCERPTPAPAVA